MIKQPYLIASILFLAIGICFFFETADFLSAAQRTVGQVSSLSAHNDRCGGRRVRYSCTKFYATVKFTVNPHVYYHSVGAGQVRGHNQPVSMADRKTGMTVATAYDPQNPWRAHEDTFIGIWGATFGVFVGHIVTLLAHFVESKKRRLP